MEGRYPAGIVVVRQSGETTPLWTELFGDSVEGSLLRRATARPFTAMTLYQGVDAASDGERLAICETGGGDLLLAMKEAHGVFGHTASSGSLDISAYGRVGPEFRTGDGKPTTGILMVGTRCVDLTRLDEFNDWYNGTHVLDQLGSGCYHTAYRYEVLDKPGEYMAIYETDATDPNEPSERILNHFRPMWAAAGRWTDLNEVTSRGAYSKVSPES
jgi:hypothetical protein